MLGWIKSKLLRGLLRPETKAMLTQRSGLARYSQDLYDLHTTGDMVSYNACMIW